MRDPQRWLSSPEIAPELKVVLGRMQPPRPPSPEESERLVSHISALAAGSVVETALTAGVLVKATAALATVALTGWVIYSALAPRHRPADPHRAPAVTRPAPPTDQPAPPVAGAPGERSTPAAVGAAVPVQEPVRLRRPARTAAATSPAPSPSVEQDPLAREEKMLEDARRDLQARPAAAIGTLERHRREFRHGQLAAEREFLRVMALKRLGRTAEAEAAAQQLRATFPDTVYAARVGSVVAPAP